MSKRLSASLLAAVLVGGMFAAVPASAMTLDAASDNSSASATEVPDTVQIEDPLGDANFLNDQGNSDRVGHQGEVVTPVDGGSVSDIEKVWFSHTTETISAHILTERPGPASLAIRYDVYAAPGEGAKASSTLGCIRFSALIGGKQSGQNTTYQGKDLGKLLDACNDGSNIYQNGTEAVMTIETVGEKGLLTITGPRSFSPLLADGQKLSAPTATTRSVIGAEQAGHLAFPTIDNTKVGTDYEIVAGGSGAPPPPEKTKPPKKKGCPKGKGKKKGCKKPTTGPVLACAPYVPGEEGAEAETVMVTDAHTAEKPLEVKLPLAMGAPERSSHAYQNVQVDSASAETGLYVRLEMATGRDLDLYLNDAAGEEVARAAGFNPAPVEAPPPANRYDFNDKEHGGHTEINAEQLDGVKVADCAGFTVDNAGYLYEGGEVTLKYWLGEIKYDPNA